MITGDDYIAVAAKLAAGRNSGEASYRSAVSRAYYGAFHLAATFLSNLGFSVPKDANAHGWIPQALIGSGHEEVEDAGHLLRDLHAERIIADYRWENCTTGNQRDAKTSVETAHAIRLALFAGGHEASKNLVRTGIQNYLQKRGE
jgi:uncharacterized protein (UPF0332 family)